MMRIFHGTHGDKIVDDSTVFEIVDSDNQSLQFRVGPVIKSRKSSVPGLWVEYQEVVGIGGLFGPVLVSPSTFDLLVKWYRKKIKEMEKEKS